jgi:DNA-binding response OmpR family regulator
MIIKGKNVLVIEDNDEHMKIAEGHLKSLKAQVFKCFTGENAIEIFKKKRIDLVLIDYRLPYKNGLMITNEMKFIRHIPIVLISGQDDIIQDIDYIRRFKFDDIITKPYHKETLVEVIEKL